MTFLWIAGGGAIGSLARFYIAELLARLFGTGFPWGTVLVNITGSFLIGAFAGGGGPGGRWIDSAFVRQFLMAGVCGGYTTFSAFSLQTFTMLQAGDVGRAGINVALSVVICVLATAAGFATAAALAR